METPTEYFMPDFRVRPDDYTVLMALDTELPAGATGHRGGHGKFPVEGWTRAEQVFTWEVTVEQAAEYAVNILIHHHADEPLTLHVRGADGQVCGTVPAGTHRWVRLPFDGLLPLGAGPQRLTLQAHLADPAAEFRAELISIELVQPAVRDAQHARAEALRADTTWMQQGRFGLMCHWTSQAKPRHGAALPYAQAVEAFDVETFADQVQATGAGFIALTTAHAETYFPAPLAALDRLLPGRTASRDLVAEIADALAARGVALMLYYHIGAASDPAWLDASGFWKTDTREIFDNWTAIVSEVGQRYGEKLAGWWFDDGTINYYYRSAPWERLDRAAKTGHPRRAVAFNPWILPSPTEFQDYYCGEFMEDPDADGMPIGPDGHFVGGEFAGLQAGVTVITEGDWVHDREDTEIGAPRWDAAQMSALLTAFTTRKNVPIFNIEIYQNGTFSPQTIAMFAEASGGVK